MPYLHGQYDGQKARDFAAAPQPMGLGMTPEQANTIARIKHIASSFTDPGDDWNRFECYNADGLLIASRTENGY